MKRKLVITNYQKGIAIVLFQDQVPLEIFFEPENDSSLIGSIYVGRIQNILRNINAAFIEIEDHLPCYYAMEGDISPFYTNSRPNRKGPAAGDELLVQVTRDAVKTKAPSVTTAFHLTGKYLVLIYGEQGIHLSSKISGSMRKSLTEIMNPYVSDTYGWIIRTNAAGADAETISKEAEQLQKKLSSVLEKALHRPAFSCIERRQPSYIETVKNLHSEEYDEILTDQEDLYNKLYSYFSEYQPEDTTKLSLYRDRLLPLSKLYSFEKVFASALGERVWLKSGAYLIIQPTEALTVIDVNSGKCISKKDIQKTFFNINLEAARETAHQLRLRNLSGIIIVDFINMETQENRDALMDALKQELKQDPQKCVVVDMTPLGLVEITRKRSRKTLKESMCGCSTALTD